MAYQRLALLALLALCAVTRGADADTCSDTLQAAVAACNDPMHAVLADVKAGKPVDMAALDPSGACCDTARAVFSQDFVASCSSHPVVRAATSSLSAKARKALSDAVAAKCGGGASVAALDIGATATGDACTGTASCVKRCATSDTPNYARLKRQASNNRGKGKCEGGRAVCGGGARNANLAITTDSTGAECFEVCTVIGT